MSSRMSPSTKRRMKEYYERQLASLERPERAPPAPAVSERRRRVWSHNSFFGHCKMAEANMRAIIASPTTTESSKRRAENIIRELVELARTLKERID